MEEEQTSGRSLLLLLGWGGLDSEWDDGWLGWLVVLWNWHSLTIGGESEESTAALTADVSILMLSHVGSWWARLALKLQFLHLTVGLNGEVLKDGLGALLVGVLDLLWGGVDLLFSLSLTTLSVNESGDGALGLEAASLNGELVLKLGGTEDNTVDGVLSDLLDLGSK